MSIPAAVSDIIRKWEHFEQQELSQEMENYVKS